MKTIINILGTVYHLWLYGQADKEGNYQNWQEVWESGNVLNLQFHITEDDDIEAPRLAYINGVMELLPRAECGSVFGYIWASREYLAPRNGYANGLVGMRYGWEKVRETVFADPQTPEFGWRLRVSEVIYKEMIRSKQVREIRNQAPAGLSQTQTQVQIALDEMPELFRKKISTLTFREKMQRYLRKPTTAVYTAVVEEFAAFSGTKKLFTVTKLQDKNFNQPHMVELIDELYDSGRIEDVLLKAEEGADKVLQETDLPESL